MPVWTAQADLTLSNLPNSGGSGTQAYIPSNAVNTYVQGICLGLVAVDSQTLPSFQTVQPLAAGTTTPNFVGVVRAGWAGFDNAGALNASYISNATYTNVQGTAFIRATVKGLEYVWVDQAGSGAVTITNGIPLVSSRNTAGYGQGVALATATARSALIGSANLPASGIGSSLTAAALAQASQTFTVAGTPAAGDVLTVTLQVPYTDNNPGTVQTHSVSVTLNATTAATTTTAAAALAAALNADPYFAVISTHGLSSNGTYPYYLATAALAVVTVTVNAQASPFLVTGGTTSSAGSSLEQWRYYTFISGMVGNSLTSTAAATGGSTLTAGGATLSGGTGYKGKVPALIYGAY